MTEDYDLEEDLTKLGTGEAVITILSERGAPTPVVWTRMRPPTSLMAAIPPADVERLAKESSLWSTYSAEIDRDSARERLAAKAERAEPAPEQPAPDRPAPAPKPTRGKKDDESAVVGYLKSREGRQMANTVIRGVFGLLKKRR
jgi:hypothetical protein